MNPTQVTQFLYSLRKAYRELEVKEKKNIDKKKKQMG